MSVDKTRSGKLASLAGEAEGDTDEKGWDERLKKVAAQKVEPSRRNDGDEGCAAR